MKHMYVVSREEYDLKEYGSCCSVWPKVFQFESAASKFMLSMREEYKAKGWKENSQELAGNITKSVLHYGERHRCILSVERFEYEEGQGLA